MKHFVSRDSRFYAVIMLKFHKNIKTWSANVFSFLAIIGHYNTSGTDSEIATMFQIWLNTELRTITLAAHFKTLLTVQNFSAAWLNRVVWNIMFSNLGLFGCNTQTGDIKIHQKLFGDCRCTMWPSSQLSQSVPQHESVVDMQLRLHARRHTTVKQLILIF